jgi:hypothetical protein
MKRQLCLCIPCSWRRLRHYGRCSTMILLALAMVACSSDDDGKDYFDHGRLINTPPGGADLGVLQPLDVVTSQATIKNVDDADGYPLTLASDSLVIISVESLGHLNPFVELYDADGFFLLADDDGGIASDALLVDDFAAGDYTILAWSSLAGPTSGDYELNVIVGPPGADLGILDPGATISVSDVFIPAGTQFQSFAFTLPLPASVDIDVLQTSGAADLALQLIDQRGGEVFFVDPAGLVDPVVLEKPLEGGTYLLIVSNEASAAAGTYDLTVTVQP